MMLTINTRHSNLIRILSMKIGKSVERETRSQYIRIFEVLFYFEMNFLVKEFERISENGNLY